MAVFRAVIYDGCRAMRRLSSPGMSLVLFLTLALLRAVPSAESCPEELRVCPTDKPITASPAELAYSKSVTRSRETALGNLVARASYSFLTARHRALRMHREL
jgi:hypothetical protein